MRAELIARYGMPTSFDLHPPDREPEYVYRRPTALQYAPDPLAYPYHMQVWTYPGLGMRVELWDQTLSQNYQLPIAAERDPEPRPDPAALVDRPDLLVLDNGRGVFRTLAPGVTPMAARAAVFRFPAAIGARLAAYLEAPGGPGDSLSGSWALVDEAGRAVARGTGSLTISACEPTARRVAEFGADVVPGRYRVDVSVSDGRARRGVVRLETAVPRPSDRLTLSDLVLLCGGEVAAVAGEAVRIEPNHDRRVKRGLVLSVYLEVDHLVVDPDGRSRFIYTYAVRPVAKRTDSGSRPQSIFEASREEEHVGPYRRQLIRAPLPSLEPGEYELEVKLTDLASYDTVAGQVRFIRD